jgi:hypothetical protein
VDRRKGDGWSHKGSGVAGFGFVSDPQLSFSALQLSIIVNSLNPFTYYTIGTSEENDAANGSVFFAVTVTIHERVLSPLTQSVRNPINTCTRTPILPVNAQENPSQTPSQTPFP